MTLELIVLLWRDANTRGGSSVHARGSCLGSRPNGWSRDIVYIYISIVARPSILRFRISRYSVVHWYSIGGTVVAICGSRPPSVLTDEKLVPAIYHLRVTLVQIYSGQGQCVFLSQLYSYNINIFLILISSCVQIDR